MKLAPYKDGSRDGPLVVVSRDLGTAHYASGIATRLRAPLFLIPVIQAGVLFAVLVSRFTDDEAPWDLVPTPDARGNLFQSKISEIHSITLLCLFNLMVELAIPTLKLVVEVVHVSTLLFW